MREFCVKFAERAFRRPLTDDQRKLYVERQLASAPDAETGITRVVLAVLKSPRFLYREVDGDPRDPYNTAARMAFGLWDSLPDRALLDAAARRTEDARAIMSQAERMSRDLRTQPSCATSSCNGCKVDQLTDLAKDPEKFPDFDVQTVRPICARRLDLFQSTTSSPATPPTFASCCWPTRSTSMVAWRSFTAKLPDADFQAVKFRLASPSNGVRPAFASVSACRFGLHRHQFAHSSRRVHLAEHTRSGPASAPGSGHPAGSRSACRRSPRANGSNCKPKAKLAWAAMP